MHKGEFISKILRRYSAFYYEYIGTNDQQETTTGFKWAWDTAFANKPILNVNGILYDYSFLLDLKITKDNYQEFLNRPTEQVKWYDIKKLSYEQADKIMLDNMYAQERMYKLIPKAEQIKQIMEE